MNPVVDHVVCYVSSLICFFLSASSVILILSIAAHFSLSHSSLAFLHLFHISLCSVLYSLPCFGMVFSLFHHVDNSVCHTFILLVFVYSSLEWFRLLVLLKLILKCPLQFYIFFSLVSVFYTVSIFLVLIRVVRITVCVLPLVILNF